METETRTVAEILGWQPEHVWYYGDCIYCGAYKVNERERSTPCKDGDRLPTPDDMLAWLRERYIGVDIHVGASVSVEPWPNHRVMVGETLHAALEVTVRAIFAESPAPR